jgi:hypothetical protein
MIFLLESWGFITNFVRREISPYYRLEIHRDARFYRKMPALSIFVPFEVCCIVRFVANILSFKKTIRGFGEIL